MNPISKIYEFCGIYMIVNQVNNHRYIGSSINIRTRLWKHRSLLRHQHHENAHLQNAWNKYGEDKFYFTVLEKCSKEERFSREQYYVDLLHPEYNICIDIVDNPPTTEETRRKHSATRKKLMQEGRIGITNNTPVFVYDNTGSFVGEWESIRKAAKALGLHYSSACRCIQGIDFQNKGYRFFKTKQDKVDPFRKPKGGSSKTRVWFVVTNIETNESVRLLGRQAVADYLGTTFKTVGIYIGGKHKYKRKYTIYRESAVVQSNLHNYNT